MFGLLPHPDEPRIFLWRTDEGCTLPYFTLFDRGLWLDVGTVRQWQEKKIGTQVNVLRRAHYHEDEATRRAESIYILESRPALNPEAGSWIGRDELEEVSLASPAQRSAIEACFAEAETGMIPAQRPPWARPGWYATAETWIAEGVAQLGHGIVEAIEPVRSWNLSCVLEARTAAGRRFYFKAGPKSPLFVDEGAVMTALAERYPEGVPRPLRVDRERRWMLMADFGGRIGYEATRVDVEAMLRAFAKMQVDSVSRSGELLAAGCVDRRLDELIAQIDPLLDDAEALAPLDRSEIDRLRQLAPALKERCERLVRCRVPPAALVHGDLHPGNVSFRADGLLIFDWTEACVAHPFLDMIVIRDESDPQVSQHLRDVYLSYWTDYESLERLREIWNLAAPVLALHHAVSYRSIYRSMEPASRHELAWGVPKWARMILATSHA